MRVASLSTFEETCGVATYSEALKLSLTRSGVDSVVLAPTLRKGDTARGEQPRRIWSRDRATLWQALSTFRAIKEQRVQLVHAQVSLGLFSPRFLGLLAQLCKHASLPFVATLHDRGGGGLRRRFLFGRAALALGSAQLIVHDEAQRAELPRARVAVIPHGIWPVDARSKEEARRALGIDPTRPLLAHFGFLHPDKGIEDVMSAVASLKAERLPSLLYWVCGGTFLSGKSRGYLAELKAKVDALGLANHVHLTGEFVSEDRVTLELQAADLVVLNYRTGNNQGASGAARRALTSGRAVAVSTAPIFDNMRSAVHTLQGPLAAQIGTLLENEDLRKQIALRARAYCETHSWQRVAEAHARLYQQLTASR